MATEPFLPFGENNILDFPLVLKEVQATYPHGTF